MMIERTHIASFAYLALLLGVGCGATSSLDECHAKCEADQRCGVATDAQAANCNSNCEANKGTFADTDAATDKMCSNAASVRKQGLDCYNQVCNKIVSCLGTVDTTCVTR